MKCNSRHTKYQPTDEEWKCPKCGSDGNRFYIEERFGSDECQKLHIDDYIVCVECGYSTNGGTLAGSIQKAKNFITCPCCNGTGLVPKKKGGNT